MGKCVSNRSKFILSSLFLTIGAALVLLIIITSIYLEKNGSAIWWNAQAVHINGTITNVETITREFIERCNPVCSGDCTNCKVNYFNAYITVRYSRYEYQYLLYDKIYHTLDYVEHALVQYKINGTISLYYNPSNPRDVHLNLLDCKNDIVFFMVAIFLFVLFNVSMIVLLRPRLEDVPKEDEDFDVLELNKPVNDMQFSTEYTAVSLDNFELQPLYSRSIY